MPSTVSGGARSQTHSDSNDRIARGAEKGKKKYSLKSAGDSQVLESRAVVDSETGDKLSLKSLDHDLAEGKMFDDLINAGIMTKKQTDMLRSNIDDLVKKMMDVANIVDLNEEYTKEDRPYSPLKPNSDPLYKISLDFTTMCRKRLITQAIVERIQVAEGKAMTPDRQLKVRELLQEYRKLDMAVQGKIIPHYPPIV